MSKSKIKVTRTKAYADSLRLYDVLLDDVKTGHIANGETIEYDIEPGKHVLRIKIDWGSSNKIEFNALQNESASFECTSSIKGKRVFLAIFYALFLSNRYIKLQQID